MSVLGHQWVVGGTQRAQLCVGFGRARVGAVGPDSSVAFSDYI